MLACMPGQVGIGVDYDFFYCVSRRYSLGLNEILLSGVPSAVLKMSTQALPSMKLALRAGMYTSKYSFCQPGAHAHAMITQL